MKTRCQWLGFWVAVSLVLLMNITRASGMQRMTEVQQGIVRRAAADAHEQPAHPVHATKDSGGADPGKKTDATSKLANAQSPVAAAEAVCGNGIVEKGEECDCGTDANCAKDPCCDRKTCKLTPGSMCSNSQSCCDKCRFRPSTFVCRSATPTCSLVQMCTGLTPTCPSARNTCHENEPRVTANGTSLNGGGGGGDLVAPDDSDVKQDDHNQVLSGNHPPERDVQCRARSTTTSILVGACPEASGLCQMYCLREGPPSHGNASSPEPPTCVQLSFNFGDGTPCGDGGTCASGKCQGDKSGESFLEKNATLLTIAGASVAGLFVTCCVGIVGYRRWQHKRTGGYYYGGRRKKEKARKVDIFPMMQTSNGKSRPKSNIRIGLDPMEPREYYDDLSFRHQNAMPSGSRPPKYAPDALKTDKELREELETDGELGWIVSGGVGVSGERRGSTGIVQHHHHQRDMSPPRPSLHASPPPLPSHVPLIPTGKHSPTGSLSSKTPPQSLSSGNSQANASSSSSSSSSLSSSSSKGKEAVYTPPPLPPSDTRTGIAAKRQSVSPYADEAMLVLPPASPPIQVVITPGRKNSAPNVPVAPPTINNLHSSKTGLKEEMDDDDDEPSLLQLNPSSLMVDESSRRQDRTSVSSFFSALQLETDPTSPQSAKPTTPTSPGFFPGQGDGYGHEVTTPLSPATALAIHLVTTPAAPSSSSPPKNKHPVSSASSVSSQSTESMDEQSDATASLSGNEMDPPSPPPNTAAVESASSRSTPNGINTRGAGVAMAATTRSSPKVVQGSTKPYQTTEYVIPTPVARRKTSPTASALPRASPSYPGPPPAPTVPPPTVPPPPAPTTAGVSSRSQFRQVNPGPLNARRGAHEQLQQQQQQRKQQPQSVKELANDLGFELVDP
ncbi:hypothetical protein BGW42_003975 [Actinomortierella wolfii]|nr:hypothetical protein BGW42_003975 [Actinomortierella wolfii]